MTRSRTDHVAVGVGDPVIFAVNFAGPCCGASKSLVGSTIFGAVTAVSECIERVQSRFSLTQLLWE